MKKRITIILIAIFMLFIVEKVDALEMSKDDIPNGSYVIGTHMFTRNVTEDYDGTLTVQRIMLAAKTIDSDNIADMKIYYKNSRGKWVDGLTSQTVTVNDKLDIQYKDVKNILPTPTVSGGRGFDNEYVEWTELTIYLEGSYTEENMASIISGAEYYEKVGQEYRLLTDDIISLNPGETKTVVARAYVEDSEGNRHYSEYSDELVISTKSLPKPTVSEGGGFDNGYIKWFEPSILLEGSYTDENVSSIIDGVEYYEKVGQEYRLLTDDIISLNPGETKTVVARAYVKDSEENRHYSEYSDELVISTKSLPKPTVSEGSGFDNGYIKWFEPSILLEGNYTDENVSSIIDGVEYYEKVGQEYRLLTDDIISLNPGETKTVVARAYVEDSAGNRHYSEYSNELVYSTKPLPKPTISEGRGGEDESTKWSDFSILLEGNYTDENVSSAIAGVEYYEKIGQEYKLLDSNEVRVNLGETKIIVARAYVEDSEGNRYYSEYSNELEFSK